MTKRSRRNPTGIDTNSALLGAGVGALVVYLLTKKETAPSAMAYVPAEAPMNDPWMQAVGYKRQVAVPESMMLNPMYTADAPMANQFQPAPDPVQERQPTESYESYRPRTRSSIPSSMLRWR